MIGGFREVADITTIKLADSPLAKNWKPKTEGLPVAAFDRPLATMCENNRHCPIEHGKWTDNRGDSKWIPEASHIPLKSNPEKKTWKEILDQFGIDGIVFKEGEPDFSEISKGNVQIRPFTENRNDNFTKADIELAKQRDCSPEEVRKWRKENGYTWHECKDMKTIQKVPSIIHNNIPHSGGISEAKKGE